MGPIAQGLFLLFLATCQASEHVWDSACKWGGLVVSKGSVKLDDSNCDSDHSKEDWQLPPPEIKFPSAEEDKLYTVLVLNPDATEHPDGSYYLHMLHANVKGNDLKVGDLSKGYALEPYIGPALSAGEGTHRYMFVAYSQEPGFVVEKMDVPLDFRYQFKLKDWIDHHGSGLNGPVAGVQFKTGYS